MVRLGRNSEICSVDVITLQMSTSKIRVLFDAIDGNGDAFVSKFEFLEFLLEHKPK